MRGGLLFGCLFAAACGETWELSDDLAGECREPRLWYVDADDDGWGDGGAEPVVHCDAVDGEDALVSLDCDDGDAAIGAGIPGAGCPADLGAAGAPVGVVKDGLEMFFSAGVGTTFANAQAACAAWGRVGEVDAHGRVPSPADIGVAGAALASGLRMWSDVRWVGSAGPALDGSWSPSPEGGSWTGGWQLSDGSAVAPDGWCEAPPSPGSLWPGLNPDDADDRPAWDAILADLHAGWHVGEDRSCLEADAEPVRADLGCVRDRVLPGALLETSGGEP